MSDIPSLFGEPVIVNPELLSGLHHEYIVPTVNHLYGGDFAEAEVGASVALKVGRGAIKVYIAATCFEDIDEDEDGEAVDSQTTFRQVDLHIAILAGDNQQEKLRLAYISREEANEDNGEDDLEELHDVVSRSKAWEYFKVTFDFNSGIAGECIRYLTLDSDEDDELYRCDSDKSKRDYDLMMSDEFSLLESAADMHFGRLIGKVS